MPAAGRHRASGFFLSGPAGAPLAFPSAAWIEACVAAVNASAEYRSAGADWVHGAVTLVVSALPAPVEPDPVAIWLDLDRGACREARLASVAAAPPAPFVLAAEYREWKRILRRELTPAAGVLTGRLAVTGSLAILLRHAHSADALVAAIAGVPTRFPDD